MNHDELDPRQKLQTKQDSQATEPKIDSEIRDMIGRGLRAMYDGLKAEPVPDRFVQLLKQLDAPDQGESQ
jgi:hypothetical protein